MAIFLLLPPASDPAWQPPSKSTQVGFSYSARAVVAAGLDPLKGLGDLLQRLQPDLVRLPVYWDDVEPRAGQFDFRAVDAQLGLIGAHNRKRGSAPRTRVVLVAGVRNIGSPEVYVPVWLRPDAPPPASLTSVAASEYYGLYLQEVFQHYRGNRLLAAWQLENEPFDDVGDYAGDDALDKARLQAEIGELRALDPLHPIVLTTFNSSRSSLDELGASFLRPVVARLNVPQPSGHPTQALSQADVLGLDIYVVTPSTPLADADARQRIEWKRQTLVLWAKLASSRNKSLWLTEMQAEPWNDLAGFGPDDLLASAVAYRGIGLDVVLLWGATTWLQSSEWMSAAEQAVSLLRA